MKENNLLYAIEQFISLNERERKIFFEVVSSKQNIVQKRQKKRKPIDEFTVEKLYNNLIKNHDDKVSRRMAKVTRKKSINDSQK